MTRDPRFALSQELEATQTLLDQLRALAADDPDFFTDVLEGETNLLELILALDASIVDDEILVDGAKTALDKLQNRKRTASVTPSSESRVLARNSRVLAPSAAGLGFLSSEPRDQRAADEIRSRQRPMAARSGGVLCEACQCQRLDRRKQVEAYSDPARQGRDFARVITAANAVRRPLFNAGSAP
jgi:hypothetical protein